MFKVHFLLFFLVLASELFAQESSLKQFSHLNGAEKCWVVTHPFIAKKALEISKKVRLETKEVLNNRILKGNGNGGQIDAFRHAFWMASLTLELGSRKSRKLGEAHEKGNYKDYKKNKLEDGNIPDKISSEMDLFNNEVGIKIAELTTDFDLKGVVIQSILNGECKIIKKDAYDNFLDCEGNYIPKENLKGKWVNDKCLVESNFQY